MNLKRKAFLLVVMALTLLLVGCGAEPTPYQVNDDAGYCVSVKYDANGGTFTTNTSVIVDAYNLADLPDNGNGQAKLALIAPDDAARGSANAFSPVQNGHFLAGWYTERTDNGDGTYSYSGRWDFATDTLDLDKSTAYTSEEPVLTLYAAWVPMFEINYYEMDGSLLETRTFNPVEDGELVMPVWEDGAQKLGSIPEKKGYTFEGAYLDQKGTQPIETATFTHNGTVDLETCTAQNPSMDIYLDFSEGQWFHITSAEQFLKHASVAGSYSIEADLDFEGLIWPSSLMYGTFTGRIEGNGHTVKNITLEQTNNSKVNAGLFGQLAEGAAITDLSFENISFAIRKGAMKAGTAYGLLTGTLSDKAQLSGVTIADSRLIIDSGCYFGTSDFAIGLICGIGSTDLDYSGIECLVEGENPETVTVETSGNTVNVKFAD